ncbi:MAG: 6-carboxytetrahydropterin synthase [Azospirillaceae bacterium]|nr:6-carboxytetrahydropterin synthase [Azospirillaceae bacterium]
MTRYFEVTRQIAIDAGHRIPDHASKCRHLHGHRYVIEATCRSISGELHASGEEAGMVLDFGFLKEEMMAVVDAPCDHGLILSLHDTEILALFAPESADATAWQRQLANSVRAQGFAETDETRLGQKLYVIAFPPTAECLARHWFERLGPCVAARSRGLAALVKVTVWETPNCSAEFG